MTNNGNINKTIDLSTMAMKVEEIKICADLLSHKEEKYSAVA